MRVMFAFTLILGSYLGGSIPFGLLFSRRGGVNIRKRGSGNIGFANVQRIMGWRYGVPTLICDVGKGALPTAIALTTCGMPLAFWVGYAAIVGHVFSIWLRLRGGKGIATGLGVVLVIVPLAALVGVVFYALCTHFKRPSAIASAGGVTLIALGAYFEAPLDWWIAPVLIGSTLFTLRHNLLRKVPDHG